jgi:hypothetical protein
MKKQVKGIIGLGAVLAVLGGGLAFLKLTDDTGSDSSDTSSASADPMVTTAAQGAGIVLVEDTTALPVPLDQAPQGDDHMHAVEGVVKSVDIVNSTGELHVVRGADKEDGTPGYTLKGYEDVTLDLSVNTIPNNANGLVSASVIEENCQDLSKFGLEDPEITAVLTYEDGVVRKYYVGIKNPASTTETYFMVDGSNTVYTVNNSSLANYYKSAEDFISRTILEAPESTDDYPIVNELDIVRDDIDYDMVIKYGENSDDEKSGGTSATHELVEPVHAFLTVERSTDVVTGMFGLTADDLYKVHCTEADIAGAGLSEPFCKVTMACGDGNTYVLLISEVFTENENERKCYVMLEGGNIIYTISADKLKWLTLKPIDITSRLIIANYVWYIDKITYKCGDSINEFEISPKDDTKDRYYSDASDFNVTRNGKAFDPERYRQLYSFLLKANGEDFALDEEIPAGEPMVSIDLNDNYLNEKHSIQFYDYSAMTTLIVVDGEPKFFGSKSYAQTLVDNIKKLDTGEEYVLTWK